MTKIELIRLLSAFSDDVEILVGGCHPAVFYLPAKEGLSAYINLEDEHVHEVSSAIQLYPNDAEES